MRGAADRYPRALAAIEAELELRGLRRAPAETAPLTAGPVGPGILRPPPVVQRHPSTRKAPAPERPARETRTEDLLGELVDLVFVSADDARSGHHEVHLVFKADVLGGLHLRLQKSPEGMRATFTVEDAAARRAVNEHIDGIIRHLVERGFKIIDHAVEIAPNDLP